MDISGFSPRLPLLQTLIGTASGGTAFYVKLLVDNVAIIVFKTI